MSKNNIYFSPQNFEKNRILFQQYNPDFPLLEKEILKLINYMRTNPEKYFNEFSKYFESDFLSKINNDLNDIKSVKLFPLSTKKEISQAGKDYLDYLDENMVDKKYFSSNNGVKTGFNLKERLSKYGERTGKIFESVIINSSCPEEIVNKLVKDEKARSVIFSPNMKYIGITCGFMSKWNSICTIIEIVQDFNAYKDINDLSTIKIISTIEDDEIENVNENFEKNSKSNKENDNINVNNLFSKTSQESKIFKLNTKKPKFHIKIDNNNFNEKEKSEENNNEDINHVFPLTERTRNTKNNPSRNGNKLTNRNTLQSPLVTYKSDAHLIFNKTNTNHENSETLERINSDVLNKINCNLTAYNKFPNFGNKLKNLNDSKNNSKKSNHNNINYINDINNINNYNDLNTENIKNINIIYHRNKKIEVRLKNGIEKDKNISEKIKVKQKVKIFHSFNGIKSKLKKEAEVKVNEKKDIGEYTTRNNSNNNKYLKTEELIKNFNNKETIKTELTDIKNIKNNNNNNYNISFDDKSYSFFSRDNQNYNNSKDIQLSTIDQNNNTNNIKQNKNLNSFFSHDTDICKILEQKDKINQKIKNVKKNKNCEENDNKDNKNKSKIDYENISFKIAKNNNEESESTIKMDEENNNEEIDENKYDNYDNSYYHNKKEFKQLIRLYNKERIEKKERKNRIKNMVLSSNIYNINNEINNNDCCNKKKTATFFYNNQNSDSSEEKDKKIKVYVKHKINSSNPTKKLKKKIINNASSGNIRTKRYYFPKKIITEISLNKINKRNNSENIISNNTGKKRIYSYKTQRSKIYKNKSYGNILAENIIKRNNLLDKYISDLEDNNMFKSTQYQFKKAGINNDNLETNVNSDLNDFVDEITRKNESKFNNKDIKEIEINNFFYNINNYNTSKNYIYRKSKIKPENKNFFNFYKTLNKYMKLSYQINDRLNSANNIKTNEYNQTSSKKKYIIPYKYRKLNH